MRNYIILFMIISLLAFTVASECGDFICDVGEDSSCPTDCGIFDSSVEEVVSEDITEDYSGMSEEEMEQYCGDNHCQAWEGGDICPEDCEIASYVPKDVIQGENNVNTPTENPDDSSNSNLIILIIAGGVFVIVIIVLVVLLTRKKKGVSTEQGSVSVQPTTSNSNQSVGYSANV